MKNPYSLVFGLEPKERVDRITQLREIVNAFVDGTQRVYMITGVRGSGKTVFMAEIKSVFDDMKDWITVELSTERDMLNALAGKLSSQNKLADVIKSAKINLSVLGLGVEIKNVPPVTDIEVALERILEAVKKDGKQLLVVVDEAVDNKYVREFVSVFQILLRSGLPINLLMTGLYENIDDLQNEKNLTFLHRAPKLHLSPLNIGAMAASYRKNLGVDDETALRMAQMTNGYSYAFQLFGFCTFENGKEFDDVVTRVRQYLEEYVYDKIWSELSPKDRKVMQAVCASQTGKVLEVRKMLGMEPNEFSPYKSRLIRKGVIKDENGYARLALPMFDQFVRDNYVE